MRHLGWRAPGSRIEWCTPLNRLFIYMNAFLALMVVAAIHDIPFVGRVAALHGGRGLRAAPSNEGCPGRHHISSCNAGVVLQFSRDVLS
jgi:hypothetical protein